MLTRMTLPQEIGLMDGVGDSLASRYTVGATAAIPRLGSRRSSSRTAPGGVGDGIIGVTQLPAPESLAATFDPTAAALLRPGRRRRGSGQGRSNLDLRARPSTSCGSLSGVGPSRALGEDPYLTGTIGAAEVRGIQRTGTMAQVKHYAVYNQETYRLDTAATTRL